MAKYVHRGQEVPIKITYGLAHGKLSDLGLDVLALFEENNQVIQTIMLNDRVMLRIWFYYLEDAGLESDFDAAIEDLEAQDMQRFREAFWEEVVNFSPPPAREALRNMWKEAKRQLKSQNFSSSNTSSGSQEEQV